MIQIRPIVRSIVFADILSRTCQPATHVCVATAHHGNERAATAIKKRACVRTAPSRLHDVSLDACFVERHIVLTKGLAPHTTLPLRTGGRGRSKKNMTGKISVLACGYRERFTEIPTTNHGTLCVISSDHAEKDLLSHRSTGISQG